MSQYLDSNSKNNIQSLFIDFTSSFNTISPTTLVNKLTSTDLDPNVINWMHSHLTNRQQKVITPNGISSTTYSSTGSPQGCVLSPIIFSIYTDQLRSTSEHINIIKFADDSLVLELLKQNQPSELQQTINNIAKWCKDHDLLINASKTKALTFLNSRDDVIHPALTINNTDIETVSDYKYLGTILNSRLKFTNNTNQDVKNTRKKLHIMNKLQHLHTSDQLRLNCYRTFIESSLLFHMTVIYHHMTDRDQQELARVTKTAGKLAKQTFKLPNEVIAHGLHNKAWRLATAEADDAMRSRL